MDTLTILLIGLGVVAVGAFIVVAYLEVARKPRKPAAPPAEVQDQPVAPVVERRSIAPATDERPAPVAPAAPAPRPAAAPTPAPEATQAPVDAPAAAPAPLIHSAAPAPTSEVDGLIAALGDGARAALLRLSILDMDFSRDTARAVAACVNDDLQALAQAGLLEVDPASQRMALPDAVREAAAALAAPEEVHAARMRHAEHYIHLGLEAQKPVEQQGSLVALALELFVEDAAHFKAAFHFLSGSRGLERQLVKLVEAVGYTTVIELSRAEATRWLEAALAAAGALGEQVAQRDIFNALATRHTDAGDFAAARRDYEQAAELSRALGDRHEEGRALGNLGLTTHRLGDHAAAVGYYEQVLEIMRDLGDRRREGLALSSLGQAIADGGDPRRAIELFEQHLAIAAEMKDFGGEAYALAGIGRAHVALGDTATALGVFEQQMTMAQRARDLPMEGAALNSLADVHRTLANHERVIEYNTRLIEIAHLMGQEAAAVRALGHIGNAHQGLGRTSKALECFDEQLRLARRLRDREGEALALADAARVVHSRGQVVDAITRASAALPIFDELKSPEADKLRAEIEAWRSEQH
ncbi:MAG: tetratricopeptide repeat protein [Opitutaceae bacterium]|nr:tetratricopeptide repeat protein [Opitutaceae bacterium]